MRHETDLDCITSVEAKTFQGTLQVFLDARLLINKLLKLCSSNKKQAANKAAHCVLRITVLCSRFVQMVCSGPDRLLAKFAQRGVLRQHCPKMKPENANREMRLPRRSTHPMSRRCRRIKTKRVQRSGNNAQPIPDEFSSDLMGPSRGFVLGGAIDKSAFCAQKKSLLTAIVTQIARQAQSKIV